MNSEPFDMLKITRVSTDILICTGNEIECLLSQQQLVAQSQKTKMPKVVQIYSHQFQHYVRAINCFTHALNQ